MQHYRLTKRDAEFLRTRLKLDLILHETEGGPISVSLETEAAAHVRELLVNLLADEGLADNDEPNALGTYIESLLDVFADQGK